MNVFYFLFFGANQTGHLKNVFIFNLFFYKSVIFMNVIIYNNDITIVEHGLQAVITTIAIISGSDFHSSFSAAYEHVQLCKRHCVNRCRVLRFFRLCPNHICCIQSSPRALNPFRHETDLLSCKRSSTPSRSRKYIFSRVLWTLSTNNEMEAFRSVSPEPSLFPLPHPPHVENGIFS